MTEQKTGLDLLREPFPPNLINLLPKPYKRDSERKDCQECGGYHGMPAMHLNYVGHAALTHRLLDADPSWTWEPLALDQNGLPQFDKHGGLWIRLTVCGVTRLGYGDAGSKNGGDAIKEAIGDALRNAGMRFGAALDLWHKGDLHEADGQRGTKPSEAAAAREELRGLIKELGIPGADMAERFRADGHGELATSEDAAAIRALIKHYREEAK